MAVVSVFGRQVISTWSQLEARWSVCNGRSCVLAFIFKQVAQQLSLYVCVCHIWPTRAWKVSTKADTGQIARTDNRHRPENDCKHTTPPFTHRPPAIQSPSHLPPACWKWTTQLYKLKVDNFPSAGLGQSTDHQTYEMEVFHWPNNTDNIIYTPMLNQ